MAELLEMVCTREGGYGGKDLGLDGAQYPVVNNRVKVPAHLADRLVPEFQPTRKWTEDVVAVAAADALARNEADRKAAKAKG